MLGRQTLITGLKKVPKKLLQTAEPVKRVFEFDSFFKLQNTVKS